MAQQKKPQRPIYPQDNTQARRTPQRPVYSGEYPPPHQKRKSPSRVDYSGVQPIITKRKEPQAAPFVNDLPGSQVPAGRTVRAGNGAAPAYSGQAARRAAGQGATQGSTARRQAQVHQRTWHDDALEPARLKPHAPAYDYARAGQPSQSATARQRPGGQSAAGGAAQNKKARRAKRKKRPLTPRQKRMRGIAVGAVLCVLALAAGTIFSLKVLFKLSNVEVRQPEEESTIYSNEEIINAMGVQMGTSLFAIDLEEVQETLSGALPYLREVQVQRRLPSSLVVSVQPAHETYTVAYEGGWAVVSEDFRVLQNSPQQPEGVAAVTGLQASAPVEGQLLKVEDTEKLDALKLLQEQTQAAGLTPLTGVDVTSLSEVSAVYDGRVKIVFGTMNDIEYKCNWAARLLLGEDDHTQIGTHETGTLDVSHRTEDGKGQAIWRAGSL